MNPLLLLKAERYLSFEVTELDLFISPISKSSTEPSFDRVSPLILSSILLEIALKLFTEESAEEELHAVEETSKESCVVGFALYLRGCNVGESDSSEVRILLESERRSSIIGDIGDKAGLLGEENIAVYFSKLCQFNLVGNLNPCRTICTTASMSHAQRVTLA